MVPEWVKDYIGLPFRYGGRTREACDCWGLARIVYLDQLGVELPALGLYDEEIGAQEQAATLLADLSCWRQVPEPQPFDLIRLRTRMEHVAVMVCPGWMLHTLSSNEGSHIDRYGTIGWDRRILGFYRWAPC